MLLYLAGILRLTDLHSRLSGVPIWPAAPMRAILVIFGVGVVALTNVDFVLTKFQMQQIR